MKAVVYKRYGSPEVLELTKVVKPVPKDNEVLINIKATSVSAGDWRMRKADPFLARLFNGLIKPKKIQILGFELAGVIESVGKEVTTLKVGEAVFAFCGLKFGGYAECTCLAEKDVITQKPTNVSFIEAATIPLGSLTALLFLRKAGIKEDKKVLIYGASGSVGTFAVQLSKYFKTHVTAVCSTSNKEMVKSIGANKVVDYTQEDFKKLKEQYDIVFDAVGKIKKSMCKSILKSNGKYVSVKKQVKPKKEDLFFIKSLVEQEQLKPVIDKIYNLEDIQEAHRYVEQFRKKGNVAVQIS